MADISSTINDALVYPAGKVAEWRTLTTETEAGGLGIRRQKWQAPRYRFALSVVFTAKTDADAFVTFFNAHAGGRDTVTWTPPTTYDTGGPYTGIFAADTLEASMTGPERWLFAFDLLCTGP